MRKKTKGFFVIEILIAVAITAIMTSVLMRHFLDSWNIHFNACQRVKVLEKVINYIDGGVEKQIETRSVRVRASNIFRHQLNEQCGVKVAAPKNFWLSEVASDSIDKICHTKRADRT
jgi:hypothetical protein